MTLESIKELFQPDERWGPCEKPAAESSLEKVMMAGIENPGVTTYQTFTTNEAFQNDENVDEKINEDRTKY